ncbi:MAG: hypothetical protein IIA89_12540 [Chloroflexi bacterium]|nr:hypothetical protein [Chloroflexota bacterium]
MDDYEKRIRAKAKRLKHEKELMITDYDTIMEKARKTLADRDRIDLESGFDSPGETPLSSRIETAMAAIEAGIRKTDWGLVAEGQAMLEIVLDKVRINEGGNQ